MKRYLVIAFCVLVSVTTHAQDVMVVEMNDNTTQEFNAADVRQIYFKSSGNNENPLNSGLTCLLKDKYGNPVLLTARGGREYSYSSDGKLIEFGKLEQNSDEHFVVDGQTFKSVEVSSSGTKLTIEGRLEFNDVGLVAKSYNLLSEIKNNGVLDETYSLTHIFSYNDEKQLIKVDASSYFEKYDNSGQVSSSGNGSATMTFTWSGGDLVNVVVVSESNLPDRLYKDAEYKYSYGNEQNVTKQPLHCQCVLLSDFGINHLYALGFFGVGSSKLPITYSKNGSTKNMSFTLNANGTIDTEKAGSDTSQYKYAQP